MYTSHMYTLSFEMKHHLSFICPYNVFWFRVIAGFSQGLVPSTESLSPLVIIYCMQHGSSCFGRVLVWRWFSVHVRVSS